MRHSIMANYVKTQSIYIYYIYIYIYMLYIYMLYIYIYEIMKTMCPPGYHHNGFVATQALGNMMYGDDVYIYIYIYIYSQIK